MWTCCCFLAKYHCSCETAAVPLVVRSGTDSDDDLSPLHIHRSLLSARALLPSHLNQNWPQKETGTRVHFISLSSRSPAATSSVVHEVTGVGRSWSELKQLLTSPWKHPSRVPVHWQVPGNEVVSESKPCCGRAFLFLLRPARTWHRHQSLLGCFLTSEVFLSLKVLG